MEAVRQIPIDRERMLDALRVPHDAGEHEAALRSLLERIPDGWGRWISCGPQAFERIVARSGVPKIRLHDARHTHGTLFIKAGVPVKVVSERLGHGTPAFTIETHQQRPPRHAG